MKTLVKYIRSYFSEIDKKVLLLTSLLTGVLIFLNYYYNMDGRINDHSFYVAFFYRYCIFFAAFAIPYFFYWSISGNNFQTDKNFLLLFCFAPAIFSLKMVLNTNLSISNDPAWNDYWNHVLYWPLLLILTVSILFMIWKSSDKDSPFFGVTFRNFQWKPYFILLLIMVPLIALASTQPDFLAMYPKLKVISGANTEMQFDWWHKLLFELSYGSDFFTIELFFRGFLVLAFVKWFGKDAILPMACFYCTIHFGKPIGECISSYFGGMILGIVVYNTRSIFGGLIVHLGIAWMMEIGGYLGNAFLGK
ncbi:MAG TPA: CPBP family intramembrane glutamic endopeptidase [Chitinophagaceae bacterium]|nr:CPBP family intramembrane glutamic endopeptidase [Chitinophagaceae bacterium]